MSTNAVRKNPAVLEAKNERRAAARVHELHGQIETMFKRLRLSVVYGGNKSADGAVIEPTNNARSWKSYEVVANDIAKAMERIGARRVNLVPDDMRMGEELKANNTHMAWLNTGGVQGLCSVTHAPAMLELFGVPYIGHDPMMAGILDSKHIFKRQLRSAGIATASFAIVLPEDGHYAPNTDPVFENAFKGYEGPFIVKPVSGRASLNVIYCKDRAEVAKAVDEVYGITRNIVLIEQYLGGREYCIAIAGPIIARNGTLEHLGHPFAFSPLERVLDADEKIFTSMDIKPISGERARLLNRPEDAKVRAELEALAHNVWNRIGIETLVRLDIRADESGKLHVLEANPKPDLKAPATNVTSLVSIGLQEFGMSYDDLIFSVFADRMDMLLSQRRGTADRLLRLI